jgi:hypothetical protein
MVVTYGNKNTCYIGMDIESTGNGEAKIIMDGYKKEALEAFPEECTKPAKTPAGTHLFEIDNECAKISEKSKRPYTASSRNYCFRPKGPGPTYQS